jgi:S1-C subfamily serine protease
MRRKFPLFALGQLLSGLLTKTRFLFFFPLPQGEGSGVRAAKRTLSIFLIGCFALLVLGTALSQEATSAFDLERIQRATVFVIQARDVGDDLHITCVGSGTIINRNGLILTNAHNTLQNPSCNGETIVIALSVRLDEPPVAKYRAEIAQADEGADLALLRITRQIDGRLIDPTTLSLPFVDLADSTSVQLDDTITVVGYPGIGNDPVSIVRGTVSAFMEEPGQRALTGYAWIKTSANIPGTMSGGGAYDAQGRLIGIPTTAPVATQAGAEACVWDTNDDGLVSPADICIPLGDAINSLRPSNFALPLQRAGSLGLQVDSLMSFERSPRPPEDAPQFRRLFFSPSVNDAEMPTTVLRSLPAGSNSLYLFFDYANMASNTVINLRVTTDGIPNTTFSLAPVRWSGGQNGIWYLGSSTQPWPNGVYEFTLFANGVAAETARLVIGGGAEQTPVFSDITFGLLDLQGNILGNGFVLPTGSTANAEFLFRNMQDGMRWTAIWYFEGEEIFRTLAPDDVWNRGESGRMTTSITDSNGLLPGNYRLELYIEDRLAATSDFIIAGAQEGVFPRIFAGTHFTSAANAQEARSSAPVSSFAAGADAIFSLFDWQQIAPGTPWTMRWSVDGDVFYEQTRPWNGPESGEDYLARLTASGGVPDGAYRMDLYVGALQLASIDARVGIGQLPIDRFALSSGAQLRGQVLDADTQQGIPGATFVLLSAEFSVEDFTWNQDQIYARAITDIEGRFEIDRLLEFSTEERPVPYSAVIVAEGYLPITADGLEVETTDENPVNMTVYMTRD